MSGPTTMPDPLLSITGLNKSYGAIRVLEDVSFTIAPGEVVALVGDNGAGKSTFIKSLSGTITPDHGEIVFDGRPVHFGHPNEAVDHGIATVYQDLAVCGNLDVVANLFLGRELNNGGVVDELEMERQTGALLAELAVFPRSLRAPVSSLSGGQRQSVAIARCLLGAPKLVMLDEPTAALGVAQKDQVVQLIRRLQARGLAVILISHNLAEVFAVADRIEVLRLGRNAGSFPGDPAYQDRVVSAITGTALSASEDHE